jgi:hypothetical protein
LSAEVRELIARLARDNPRWGSERIRGELLKLGLVVSKRSIQRYRRRGPAHPSSQTWRTFLANHAHHVWAADLLTVQTLTFKTLYILVFIAHRRRELVHLNVTASPTAAWVWRQVIEATPWGNKPHHLLRDHDAVYGRGFRQRARWIGIDTVATPVASPRANAVVEQSPTAFCAPTGPIGAPRRRRPVQAPRQRGARRPARWTASASQGRGAQRGGLRLPRNRFAGSYLAFSSARRSARRPARS